MRIVNFAKRCLGKLATQLTLVDQAADRIGQPARIAWWQNEGVLLIGQ
jgi:hypothetical protein